TRTQGVDVTADLRLPVGRAGTLHLTGALNYTKNEIARVNPLPAVLQNSPESRLLDVVTRVAIEEEQPDWRSTATAQYSTGRFHALARGSRSEERRVGKEWRSRGWRKQQKKK